MNENIAFLKDFFGYSEIGKGYTERLAEKVLTNSDAGALLAINMPENRNISSDNLRRLEKAIESGEFLCVEPLIIDKDGWLVNGQHRLQAAANVKHAGVKMLFLLNVAPESRYVIDRGKKRSTNDGFTILGYEKEKVTILKYCLLGQKLTFLKETHQKKACCPFSYTSLKNHASLKEVEKFYLQNKECIDWVHDKALSFGWSKGKGSSLCPTRSAIPLSVWARAYASGFNHKDLEIALEIFLNGTRDDEKPPKGASQMVALREFFIGEGRGESEEDLLRKYKKTEKLLSDFLNGKSSKDLLRRSSGYSREQFPVALFDRVTNSNKILEKESRQSTEEIDIQETQMPVSQKKCQKRSMGKKTIQKVVRAN